MKNDSVRDDAVQRVIIIEGSANLLVLIAKLVAGFSSGSLAILSDAMHSLTDLANNIVAWFVIKISRQPPDKRHPYGHRKFETLAVFFLATLLTLLAFEIILEVFRREQDPKPENSWELILMLAALGANVALASWQRAKAKQLTSELLHADASHTFADVLTTVAVIVGWQLSIFGYPFFDKLCALVVAGMVLRLAYQLFKRAAPSLLDEEALEADMIREVAMKIEGVHGISRIRSRAIGQQTFVDMVVEISADMNVQQSAQITDRIATALKEKFAISETFIQVTPLDR